ncbi:MAG TPA: DsbA family oxidoreductase [Actinomycetales bacterium]|nr:DsbA family oxidoreductase [Actinomycetales bacterium]
MRIDIWSDVVCPFCWIGKRHLEAALDGFRVEHPDAEVEVVWRAYELDPQAPASTDESNSERLAAKYGMPVAEADAMQEQIAERFRAVGLEFDWRAARATNTHDAHRLAALATARGRGDAADEALKRAHFTDGELLSDPAVLSRIGTGIGLPAAEVDALLAGDAYADEVRRDQAEARALGVTGVPFFVLDGRLAVSGAQPTDLFRQALERAWREGPVPGASPGREGDDGEACADGTCSV